MSSRTTLPLPLPLLLSLLSLLIIPPPPVFADPAAIAVTSSGSIVTIQSSGSIATLAASKYSTGPSCARLDSTSTFFALQRAPSSPPSLHAPAAAARVRLVGINTTSGCPPPLPPSLLLLLLTLAQGSITADDDMPFSAPNATAFADGLDFYLSQVSGVNASGGEGDALVAVGGDEAGFVHVLSVKVSWRCEV